jgi:hypothetical protein
MPLGVLLTEASRQGSPARVRVADLAAAPPTGLLPGNQALIEPALPSPLAEQLRVSDVMARDVEFIEP